MIAEDGTFLNWIYREPQVTSTVTTETLRTHTRELFENIGVSRVIVVDDEYSNSNVEDLLGICAEIGPTLATNLPHLDKVDFYAPRAIWADRIREAWERLEVTSRQELMVVARSAVAAEPPLVTSDNMVEGIDDATAASSLEGLLDELVGCEYITLSLGEWNLRSGDIFSDQNANSTVLLFDRDFSGEDEGTADGGFELIREAQAKETGYCGLISHTIPKDGEYDAWFELAEKHNLDRDRFVVISKARLTGDAEDYYGFLGMLRLVVLSGRIKAVKSGAWSIFQDSVDKAKEAMERLSILDFDKIVFESSRREGVWEPDTLFRIFGILMRRQARLRLHEDKISSAVAQARSVSAMPEEIAAAVREDSASQEALRIQRFELYETGDDLNRSCAPIELGDIFETVFNKKRYILLAQPCDLMVRSNGTRSYDDKLGRTAALVEIAKKQTGEAMSWGELSFYDNKTGKSAFVNFRRTHQVQLAILDLCAIHADGSAVMQVDSASPDLLIPPWKARYKRLEKVFGNALGRWESLADKRVKNELKSLALPKFSTTVRVDATVNGNTIQYGLKRVMRLRQPRSGALLTSFTQYQARTAFEHVFDPRPDA